ncbi:uncharacterized protein LOC141900552 [Tubulanus polymorphus]|uniref:uncharacterized protein LOC141900552 n=1 Tax=Tubulanus polymorphus TaxID=672921 RepID=UPI003DA4AF73
MTPTITTTGTLDSVVRERVTLIYGSPVRGRAQLLKDRERQRLIGPVRLHIGVKRPVTIGTGIISLTTLTNERQILKGNKQIVMAEKRTISRTAKYSNMKSQGTSPMTALLRGCHSKKTTFTIVVSKPTENRTPIF